MNIRLAFLTASLCLATVAHAADGKSLAQKEADAYDGYGTEKALYELILIDAKGVRTERKLEYFAREVDGKGDQSRIEITDPADVKGTRLLTHTQTEKADKQWLYLPALGAVKRISGGGKTGAFMGSEFSYEDLTSFEPGKYTYEGGEAVEVSGRSAQRYTRIPTDPASGYSKVIVDLDDEYLQPLVLDFYDRKGDHMKTMTFTGYQKVSDEWRWGQIKVDNHQTGKKSELNSNERNLGVDLDNFFFDSATLGD